MNPSDFKYTSDHEWIKVTGKSGSVGITDYAQKQLGDIVFIDLPEIGKTFKKGDQFGSVESVKAVSDLYCPTSGEVIDVNTELPNNPEQVNKNPHGAWMIELKLSNPDEIANLLSFDDYEKLIQQ